MAAQRTVPLAALRTALRTGVGNKAGGGRHRENQACKDRGNIEATREEEDTSDLDQVDRGNAGATREGEDTPKLNQAERGNIEARGAGLDGVVKGSAAEGATRSSTEAEERG